MASTSHVRKTLATLLTRNTSDYRFLQRSRYFAADARKLKDDTRDEIKYWRGKIFDEEKEHQQTHIGRLEKIKVNYIGLPDNQELMMNKYRSTPYNCAQHLGETHVNKIVLALVNGKPWDSHRPLVEDCELRILSSTDEEKRAFIVNQTLWRSFSLMLGAVIENSFKSKYTIELHSFPSPDVRSGSFVYDVDMGDLEWNPTKMEMKMLSAQMMKLAVANIPIEPLDVSADIAQEIFQNNKYKTEQIPHMASQRDGKVTVYRLGDHYDISGGPAMTHTGLLGRCTVTALHPIETSRGRLWRFQGVGLTKDVHLNHMAYGIIENRGSKLNMSRGPSQTRKQ